MAKSEDTIHLRVKVNLISIPYKYNKNYIPLLEKKLQYMMTIYFVLSELGKNLGNL